MGWLRMVFSPITFLLAGIRSMTCKLFLLILHKMLSVCCFIGYIRSCIVAHTMRRKILRMWTDFRSMISYCCGQGSLVKICSLMWIQNSGMCTCLIKYQLYKYTNTERFGTSTKKDKKSPKLIKKITVFTELSQGLPTVWSENMGHQRKMLSPGPRALEPRRILRTWVRNLGSGIFSICQSRGAQFPAQSGRRILGRGLCKLLSGVWGRTRHPNVFSVF